MSVSEILNKAADLLETPGVWIQGREAKDKNMFGCSPHSHSACHFCILGALEKYAGPSKDGVKIFDLATYKLRSHIRKITKIDVISISCYNDDVGRTAEEVVKTLREVAKEQNV